MVPYMTIPRFAAETGYTPEAIRAKIKGGVWLEGIVWKKAPDGHVLISVKGYELWVDGQQLAELQRRACAA